MVGCGCTRITSSLHVYVFNLFSLVLPLLNPRQEPKTDRIDRRTHFILIYYYNLYLIVVASIQYTGSVFRSITQTKHITKPHTLDPAGRRAVRVSTAKFV